MNTPIIKGQSRAAGHHRPSGATTADGHAGASRLSFSSNLADLSRGTRRRTSITTTSSRSTTSTPTCRAATWAAVSADVQKIVDAVRPDLPRGSSIVIRGQVESMNSSFLGLATGLVFAVLLVYLLMVVNFQSWLDPFIILTALPGALAGILWMLYLTQTTLSVPALMGAIMCIGVATSNSILMVTFANDQRRRGARRPRAPPWRRGRRGCGRC